MKKKANLTIFYQEVWVEEITVTIHENNILPIDAVRLALKGTKITVSIWQDNLVLLPFSRLINHLPAYHTQEDEALQEKIALEKSQIKNSAYLKGRAIIIENIR